MHASAPFLLGLLLLVSIKTVTAFDEKDVTRRASSATSPGEFSWSVPWAIDGGSGDFEDRPKEERRSRRLVQQTDDNQSSQDSLCNLSSNETSEFLNNETRIWTVSSSTLENMGIDFGDVVNCTRAGDVIRIGINDTIRPATRVVIPWNLTLTASTEETDLGGDVLAQTAKATFRCPRKEGIFLIRSSNVMIANIVFRDCSLKREHRSIVQVDRCDADATDGTIRLHHVIFRGNSLDGARGVSVIRPSCSSLELVDVVFSDNACGDGCFGSFSLDNTLRGVDLQRNTRLSRKDASSSLMLMPPRSISSVSRLVSKENGLSSIRVDRGGRVEVGEAELEGNGEDSAIVLDRASRVRIADSTFRNNSATLSGAAILVNGTERLTLTNCIFESNYAQSGGAIASTDTDLRIRNCSFQNNIARDRGGAIFVEKNVLDMQSSVFENNSASTSGGALSLVEVAETSLFDIRCSNNTSGNGGCLQSSRSGELFIQKSVLSNNNVSEDGGGAQLIEQSSAIMQEVNWTSNIANQNGGGFHAESSNVTSQASLYISNQANQGAGFLVDKGTSDSDEDVFSGNTVPLVGGGIAAKDTQISLRNCRMMQNQGHRGGGIDVLTSELTIYNVTFSQNFAHTSRGGGLACHQSSMNITDSVFVANAAINSGGAMDANLCNPIIARNLIFRDNHCSSVAGGISLEETNPFNISDSVLRNNSASVGGAMYLGNSTVFMDRCRIERNAADNGAGMSVYRKGRFVLENSEVLYNQASLGGGVYTNDATFIARNVTFRNNSADVQGGALFGDKTSVLAIRTSDILDNRSKAGGGIFGRTNSSIAIIGTRVLNNSASETGGGVSLEYSMVNVRRSSFSNNKAAIGGSLFLIHSNLHVKDTNFSNEVATVSGGSIALIRNSSATAIDVRLERCSAMTGGGVWLSGSNLTSSGLWISSCHADVTGGGVLANESSQFLCSDSSFSDNEAAEHGGGIAFESDLPQHLALQLNACAFNSNSANLGGAVYASTRYSPRDCSQANASCTFIAITGCGLSKNSAGVTGGGIFVQDANVLRYSCSSKETSVPPGLYSNKTLENLDTFFPNRTECSNWISNEAGRYGPTLASYAQSTRASITNREDPNEEQVLVENNRAVVRDHRSGDPLPPLFIDVVDGFDQVLSLGREDTDILATISSPNRFLSGKLTVPLDERHKQFPAISDLQKPGVYDIYINFSEPELPALLIEVEVRSCRIGEFAQENGALCVPCSGSQYNFRSNDSSCVPCPEHGNCTTNIIHPEKGYWHRTPCSPYVQMCLSREACVFTEREEDLRKATQDLDSCDFDETRDAAYADAQCKEGYTGVLCGSCKTGYGRSLAFNCGKCFSDFAAAVLFVLSLIVLFGLSAFAIRSNLPRKRNTPATASRVSRRNRIPVMESERIVTDVPVDFQMVEMLQTGYVPPEIVHPDLIRSAALQKKMKDDPALAKHHIVEIFKITVNFLQIVASAASINADWNTWMLSLLSAADFVSGAASEGIVLSIDCFFNAGQEPARSILRTVISLFVPVVVLTLYIAFWITLTRGLGENIWYFARRALLSSLVVAYLTYVSVTRTAVNALYCIDVHDSVTLDVDQTDRYWAADTSLKCYEGSHAALATMLGWPVVVVISAGLPVILIYALIKQRSLEADKILWFSDATSFLYRAYKERFVFWESIIMFRKAILATIIVFCYPLGPNIQGILALSVLTCATYAHFSCQPYKKEFNALNSYETASLFVSQLTFAAGLLFGDERTSNTAKVLLTISLSVAICGLFLFFLHKTLKTAETYVRAVFKEEGLRQAQEWGTYRVLAAYCLASMSDSLNLLFQKRLDAGASHSQSQSRASTDV